jgi:hypothetical protein
MGNAIRPAQSRLRMPVAKSMPPGLGELIAWAHTRRSHRPSPFRNDAARLGLRPDCFGLNSIFLIDNMPAPTRTIISTKYVDIVRDLRGDEPFQALTIVGNPGPTIPL